MGRCNWFLLDISNGIWNTALNWCKCWWKLNDCYSHPPHFVGSATRYWWLYKYVYILVGGWPTPLKNMKVSWDYYSQHMEKKHVPNHQPVYIYYKKKTIGWVRYFHVIPCRFPSQRLDPIWWRRWPLPFWHCPTCQGYVPRRPREELTGMAG